jgi:chromosome segregation ATPase
MDLIETLEGLRETVQTSRQRAEELSDNIKNEIGDDSILEDGKARQPSADTSRPAPSTIVELVREVSSIRSDVHRWDRAIGSIGPDFKKMQSTLASLRARLATLNESRKNMAEEIVSTKDDNSRLAERIETDVKYLQHTRWALLTNTIYTRDAVFGAMKELNILCTTIRQAKSQWPALYDSMARSVNPVIDAVKLVQARNLQVLQQCTSEEEKAYHKEIVSGSHPPMASLLIWRVPLERRPRNSKPPSRTSTMPLSSSRRQRHSSKI